MQWVPSEKKEQSDALFDGQVTEVYLIDGHALSPSAIHEALAQPEQESDDLTAAYMSGFHAGKNTPQRKPDQEPVACPFPCGWKRLFEIIVADGAFLARSLEEGEAITEHQREVVMHVIGYAKDMALHGMEATPPQRKWVGLTDEEIEAIGKDDKVLLAQFHTSVKAIDEMKDPTAQVMNLVIRQQGFNFAKAIEAKLREKNGG